MEALTALPYILPGLLVALVLHEYAHARTADLLGDPTARAQGRVTLNPLAHLDPVGTLVLIFTGRFGWARPVPVNPYYFRDARKGMLLVALAGPLTNLVLAFLILLVLAVASWRVAPGGYGLRVLAISYQINLSLAVFNLIPVPPLDGSRILAGLVPVGQARWIHGLERYGFLILVVLLFTGAISRVMLPVLGAMDGAMTWLVIQILRLFGLF